MVRTDELIDLLAVDSGPVARGAPERRLSLVAAAGALVAGALVLAWLGLRPDLGLAVQGGFFWIKAAFTAALAACFYTATRRLARPEHSAPVALTMAAIVFAGFAAIAAAQFSHLDPAGQVAALKGGSWTVCSRNIFVLGAPTTLMTLLVLRGLAPTKPILAGLVGGLFSGALAATVYGLHCPEATFIFVSLWYSLGMLGCGLLGAVLGRWMLRW